MRLCDLDEIKVCVDRQYENCHGYSGSKKAIYREAILAVKSILHSAKSIDGVTVQEWISINERLPEEYISVLGYMTDAGKFPPVRECYRVGNAFFFPALKENNPISYWCEIPQPPKGE